MTSIETQGEFIDSEDCIPENVKAERLRSPIPTEGQIGVDASGLDQDFYEVKSTEAE
jgi:hypothetical protein